MKVSELKKLIKPLVEECVKESVREIMLESGLLSSVITEVMKGIGVPSLLENTQRQTSRTKEETISTSKFQDGSRSLMKESEREKIQETKKRLLGNIGKDAYRGVNIFEGIKETIPNEITTTGPGNPLSGIDPNDPGVNVDFLDINRIRALAKGNKV